MNHSHHVTDIGLTTRRLIATFTLLLVMAGTTLMAQSPSYSVATNVGGTGNDDVYASVTGGDGNTFLTGRFTGTVDFTQGMGTSMTATNPNGDIYVACYDPGANYQWAFSLGGQGGVQSIAVDGNSNVVVAGRFYGTADFNPGSGIANLTASGPDGYGGFVAKYTATGQFIWAFTLGSSTPTGVKFDGNGNVVVTGGFDATVDFNPDTRKTASLTPVKVQGNTTEDIFVAKYSVQGTYLWAFRIGTAGQERTEAVALDGSGNIYITGWFGGTMDFNPSSATANLTTPGVFVARYSSAGAYLGAFRIGGFYSSVSAIAVDANGNSVVTGVIWADATYDFDPGTGIASITAVAGMNNIFVARYSASGVYQWAFSPAAAGRAEDVTMDSDGDIYLTGGLAANPSNPEGYANDFDPGSGTVSFIRRAGFVVKYSSAGAYIWAIPITAESYAAGAATGRGISVNPGGDVYVAGNVIGTCDFDPGSAAANLPSAGGSDIFFARYTPSSQPKRTVQENTASIAMTVAPNPFTGAVTIRYEGAVAAARVEIIDMMGRVVEAASRIAPDGAVTLGDDLPAGSYLVRVIEGNASRQAMVQKVR